MIADGETILDTVYHIGREYERVEENCVAWARRSAERGNILVRKRLAQRICRLYIRSGDGRIV
jgi:hypothetical protein